jgi:arsenate reductase
MADQPLILHYAACDTCRKALRWLEARGLEPVKRPIVDAPPTIDELRRWVPASDRPLKKWLNTSGQSYRALGKAAIDAMTEDELLVALSRDGKLVKRPVLVVGERVVVGFDEGAYASLF